MKHLFYGVGLLFFSSVSFATTGLEFSGGEYNAEVKISDSTFKIFGLSVFEGDKKIISITGDETEVERFEISECQPEKEVIHVVLPATASHVRFELVAHHKKGHMTLGTKRIKLNRPDWSF